MKIPIIAGVKTAAVVPAENTGGKQTAATVQNGGEGILPLQAVFLTLLQQLTVQQPAQGQKQTVPANTVDIPEDLMGISAQTDGTGGSTAQPVVEERKGNHPAPGRQPGNTIGAHDQVPVPLPEGEPATVPVVAALSSLNLPGLMKKNIVNVEGTVPAQNAASRIAEAPAPTALKETVPVPTESIPEFFLQTLPASASVPANGHGVTTEQPGGENNAAALQPQPAEDHPVPVIPILPMPANVPALASMAMSPVVPQTAPSDGHAIQQNIQQASRQNIQQGTEQNVQQIINAILPGMPPSGSHGQSAEQQSGGRESDAAKLIPQTRQAAKPRVIDPSEGSNQRPAAAAPPVEPSAQPVSSASDTRKPVSAPLPQNMTAAAAAAPRMLHDTADSGIGKSAGAQILQRDAGSLYQSTVSVLDQISSSMVVQLRDKNSEMRVFLQPESLGEVLVKVKQNGGKLEAEIEASNPTTRTMLEGSIPQLREYLVSRGVDLQRIEVAAEHQASMNTASSAHQEMKHNRGKQTPRPEEDAAESEGTLRNLGYNTMEHIV